MDRFVPDGGPGTGGSVQVATLASIPIASITSILGRQRLRGSLTWPEPAIYHGNPEWPHNGLYWIGFQQIGVTAAQANATQLEFRRPIGTPAPYPTHRPSALANTLRTAPVRIDQLPELHRRQSEQPAGIDRPGARTGDPRSAGFGPDWPRTVPPSARQKDRRQSLTQLPFIHDFSPRREMIAAGFCCAPHANTPQRRVAPGTI